MTHEKIQSISIAVFYLNIFLAFTKVNAKKKGKFWASCFYLFSIIIEFPDDTSLRRAVDSLEVIEAQQRDLDKSEDWVSLTA